MRIEEIMKDDVMTISIDATADEAFQEMKAARIRHLVVIDKRKPVGVISDRDLGGRNGGAVRRNKTAGELMTPAPVTATPKTTVREAANVLRGRAIGCLPVVERSELVGIVTTSDLLELIGRGSVVPPRRSRWTNGKAAKGYKLHPGR